MAINRGAFWSSLVAALVVLAGARPAVCSALIAPQVAGALAVQEVAKPAPTPQQKLNRLTLNTLSKDMSTMTSPEELRQAATRMLELSAGLRELYADDVQFWSYRAAAALALDQRDSGAEAGCWLMQLGALDGDDGAAIELVSRINAKGWLETRAAAEVLTITLQPDNVEFRFRWIPPGSFTMGSPASELGRAGGEGPQRRVRFAEGFWLQETEVTQAQWKAVMGSYNNPSHFNGDTLPVETVSWNDARVFIAKLNQNSALLQRGLAARLPFEEEWEYACRAGTTTPFHFGPTISPDQANYNGNYTYGNGRKGAYRLKTTPVRSFPANAWGLHDMHGNVWEWCEDVFRNSYSGAPTDGSAVTQSGANDSRVLRGGSWRDYPWDVRSAGRDLGSAGYEDDSIGLRLVLDSIIPAAGELLTITLQPGHVEFRFRWIPAGSFMMGSPANEADRVSDEGPQRRVTVAEGFWLQETEVTQAQWKVVMGSDNNPSRFTGDTLPMENVSWTDAKSFIEKFNQSGALQERVSARLPSEAEWEYACRAGTTTPFHFGPTISPDQANYNGNSTYGNGPNGEYRETTMAVKSFPENAWGLYDMHGNVWEWCEDVFRDSYSGTPTDGSAVTQGTATDLRVLRGGSWANDPMYLRSAYRQWRAPDRRSGIVGFRLALDSN